MDKDISIGYWIKRRRKSLDLTQKDLADRVGCALITIAKIEADQRRPSRDIALLLARHLQLPEQHHKLFVSVMRGEKSSLQLQKITFGVSYPGEAQSSTWKAPGPETAEGETLHGVILLKRISRGRLVGRSSEVALAMSAWQTACFGEAITIFIHGEPGIGKSRLALEVLNHVRQEGGSTLVGNCFSGSERPYAPFSRILQNVSEIPEELHPTVISDLKIIAPQLEARFPGTPDPHAADPVAEKLRLFESAFLLFQKIVREKPAALLIEDIHWADSGTLELIQSLARRFREAGLKILLILTTRNEIPAGAYDVTSLIDELQRAHLSTSIYLERFDLEGTRALLASIFEQQITDEFISLIHRETQGNPFFIEEVCKDMIESGSIYWKNGGWEREELDKIHVPKSVQYAIQARLKKLPQEALEVLRMAAVLGKRFEFDTLKAAAGLEEDDLIEALETARQSQILVDVDSSGGGSFEFSHNLICTVIIELTSSPRRRRLHQQAIRALEEIQPNEYGILAWHCREAGEALRSAIYFRKAAERAIQAYAHEDALRFCSESLSLSAQDPAETCRIHLLREKVFDLRGDRSMQLKDLESARLQAETAGDIGLQAEVELAVAGYYIHASNMVKVNEHVKRAIDLAGEANLPAIQAQVYMLWGRALSDTGELEEARERLQQAGDLGRRFGLRLIEARSMINLGNVDYRLGEYDAAREKYIAALDHVRALGERRIECMTLNNLGNIAWLKSSLEDALDLYQKSYAIALDIGDRLNQARTLGNIGSLLTEQFRPSEAMPNLELALALSRELGQRADEVMALSHLGDAMEAMGQYEAACAYKEEAVRVAQEISDVQAEAEILAALSCIQLWLDDQFKAEQLAKVAVQLAHAHGLPVEEATSWRALGMVHLACERWDAAADAFSAALSLFRETTLEQKCREMYSELARLAEQAGDHPRAMEYLRNIVPELNPEILLSITEPFVCLGCYLVLKNEDPAMASIVLDNGYKSIQHMLQRIPDMNTREHYRKIPNHKLLVEIWWENQAR